MGIIMRNGVAYGGGTGDTDEFVGTSVEWNALTTSEKAQYKVVNFTDDYSFSQLLIVNTTTGSTVTLAKSGYVINAKEVESGKFTADIPDWGTYTITVSLNGGTNTETLTVDTATIYEVDIDEPTPAPTPPTPSTVTVTLTVYSATEDTLSYTDIDGVTQTIVFASDQSSKSVDIEIAYEGSSLTFTSSIAKNPSNLSNDYSKTVAITRDTTEIYIMPNNALYWWGYMSDDFEICNTANGWSWENQNGYTLQDPTLYKNYIDFNPALKQIMYVGLKTSHTLQKVMCVARGITLISSSNVMYGDYGINPDKSFGDPIVSGTVASSSMVYNEISTNNPVNAYIDFGAYGLAQSISGYNNERCYLYALWYE